MHLLKGRGKGATGSRERGSEERNPEPAREAEAAPEGSAFGLPGRAGAGTAPPSRGEDGPEGKPGEGPRRGEGKGKALPALTAPGARPEERSSLPARPRPRPPVSLKRGALPSGRAPPAGRAQGVGEPAGSARKRPGPAGTPTPGKGPARPRTRTHRALRGEGAGERSGAGRGTPPTVPESRAPLPLPPVT